MSTPAGSRTTTAHTPTSADQRLQTNEPWRHCSNRICHEREYCVQPHNCGSDLIAPCEKYLKDGETPAQCIERNRVDIDAALGLLAKARTERDSLKAQNAELMAAVRIELAALIEQRDTGTTMLSRDARIERLRAALAGVQS